MDRRQCIAQLGALLLAPYAAPAFAGETIDAATGNFRYIYADPELRAGFLDFLTNVFHLYPQHDFHQLLDSLSQPGATDEDVYRALQAQLGEISPFLGALRYAIPALKAQKVIMAEQTLELLDGNARYDGYLEIGSTGRYISTLEDRLDIEGDVFLLHTQEGGYGPEDIVERGQLPKIGTHVDMGDYSIAFADTIPHNSLDLVTVYIGFHHCPLHKRRAFIGAVRDVMRPGAKLILRDHDARDEDMWRMAALAHDTFNAGTNETWRTNRNEVRNFYSLRYIVGYLEDLGLRYDGDVYFQPGDPTRNGLMAFTKV